MHDRLSVLDPVPDMVPDPDIVLDQVPDLLYFPAIEPFKMIHNTDLTKVAIANSE
jgi:hypothetical protein